MYVKIKVPQTGPTTKIFVFRYWKYASDCRRRRREKSHAAAAMVSAPAARACTSYKSLHQPKNASEDGAWCPVVSAGAIA